MTKNNRGVAIKVRLTAEEKDLLKEQSERTGRSMSDVIRAAWNKMRIVELPPADFSETVVQLRRIGSDLRQLTRAASAGEVDIPEIKSVLGEIAAIDKRLTKILSGGGL